jgi:hypothetical protein
VGTGAISEDCLTLNVSTAATTTTDRLPVMVFFHGGRLTIGTANSDTYNNDGLPRHEAVVVTVNSRLGPLPYLAHPALTAESEHHASGNYGTLDLIASLEWVQGNIGAFGGDPHNVLIFGESGGGTKTPVAPLLTAGGWPLPQGHHRERLGPHHTGASDHRSRPQRRGVRSSLPSWDCSTNRTCSRPCAQRAGRTSSLRQRRSTSEPTSRSTAGSSRNR